LARGEVVRRHKNGLVRITAILLDQLIAPASAEAGDVGRGRRSLARSCQGCIPVDTQFGPLAPVRDWLGSESAADGDCGLSGIHHDDGHRLATNDTLALACRRSEVRSMETPAADNRSASSETSGRSSGRGTVNR